MLATDQEQRTEVGSTLESFPIQSEQVYDSSAMSHTQSLDALKAESEARENVEISGMRMFL